MFRNLSTYVLALLLGLPVAALAQGTGTLAGQVTDNTGAGLPGATVQIVGTPLGAVTGDDGSYRVIGVPVGQYTISASFVGFETQTVTNVEISSGITRDLDFRLGEDAQQLEETVVEYERPILENDAIGVPRVVTQEDLQNLPVRGVNNVAALQGGVVAANNSGELYIRGGREQEVAYYVDGVKVAPGNAVGVGQGAIAEQEMLIGSIPARYGDVQGGVISITTPTGRDRFFGSAEAITSEQLDAYGYNLFSLSLGGPVIPNRIGFFLSGEGNFADDTNPYGVSTYQLSDEAFAQIQAAPQVLEFANASGETTYVPITFDITDLTFAEVVDSLGTAVPEGFTLTDQQPLSRAETFTESDFTLQRGKNDPLSRLTLNGSLNFDLTSTTALRLGGGFESRDRQEYSFTNSLYNRNRFNNDERDSYRMYGTLRQRVGDNAFFQLQGEFQDFKYVQYPEGFSSNIEDQLSYGDIDNAYNATALGYYTFIPSSDPLSEDPIADGVYQQLYSLDSGSRPDLIQPGTFASPGTANTTTFEQQHNNQFRFSGSATTQIGVNQLEFGAEYEQQTQRFFRGVGTRLARYVADESNAEGRGIVDLPFSGRFTAEGDSIFGVDSYEALPYQAFGDNTLGGYYYYGYNYNGTEEVDDENIQSYFNGTDANGDGSITPNEFNRNVAPYRPVYYAGYIQDKIEFEDLVINLGLRADVFDNNTQVLRDLFAIYPINRANLIADRPTGIGEDFAVYYDDDNETVLGYRDLDGNFYDANGEESDFTEIVNEQGGNVVRALNADGSEVALSEAYEPYEAQVTIMPRVGVSFPVTDRALFFASYNVTSQRPTEFAFAPFSVYRESLTSQDRLPNSALEPEQTTQYELGFRQRLGERAALTLSGFYRTQENKVAVRRNDGGTPPYSTYRNLDFTTSQGVEVAFDLRRTRNLALTANYTLAFAKGTGSDAGAVATIAWRGTFYPNFITAADFDQRHTFNTSVDYRFADDEGPEFGGFRPFENFGVNLVGQFGSGQRYTPLNYDPSAAFNVNDSFTNGVRGGINSGTLPGYTRFDLRVDRSFNLGLGGSNLKAYLWVQDLFDTQNVTAVYRATGLPNEDGYLQSSGAQSAIFGSRTPEGLAFNYNAYISGPVNNGDQQSSGGAFFYDLPRQVRLGLLLDF